MKTERTLEDSLRGRAAEPGQDIVVSKWIALGGTAVLAQKHRSRLSERYPAWLVEEAGHFDRYLSTETEEAVAVREGARVICRVAEGGIFAALWELAEGAGVGLRVDLKKIPIRQETVEVCNHLGINPYELFSEGCLLITCDSGEALSAALQAEGIPAVKIGKITDGRDKLILNEDDIRYLNRPRTDEIYQMKGEQI